MSDERRSRSYSRKQKEPVQNKKVPIIAGVAAVVVLVIGYFIYTSWQHKEYVRETLGYVAQAKGQLEKGDFDKSRTTLDFAFKRMQVKPYFSEAQKQEVGDLQKTIVRQVELKSEVDKIRLERGAETTSSLEKMVSYRKNFLSKLAPLEKEMGPFLLEVVGAFKLEQLEIQKNLFKEAYSKKNQGDWQEQLKAGLFIETAEAVKKFMEDTQDPVDSEWSSFVAQRYPLGTNSYILQAKTYQEGLAIYEKGLSGTDAQYEESLTSLANFIKGVPKESSSLRSALENKLALLKTASASRIKSQIDKLPLDQGAEREKLYEQAFAFQMPVAEKIKFQQVAAADLKKIAQILKENLPKFTEEKTEIIESENYIVLTGKEYSVTAGYATIKNDGVRYFVLVLNGIRIAFSPAAVNEQQFRNNPAFASIFLNFAYETARNLKLTDEAYAMAEQYWTLSRYSYWGVGLIAETEKDGVTYFLCQDKIFQMSFVEVNNAQIANTKSEFHKKVKSVADLISNHKGLNAEVAGLVSFFLTGISDRLDPSHYLPNQFAQLALTNGYFENAIPNCPDNIKSAIEELKQYYQNQIEKPILIATGKKTDGSEIKVYSAISNFNSVTVYDKEREETTFIRSPFVIELDGPYMMTTRVASGIIYKGKQETDLETAPLRIETRHFAGGILAVYDAQTNHFYNDQEKWERNIVMPFSGNPIYGKASTYIPSHVLKVDAKGNVLEMYVPHGTFMLEDFTKIKDEEEKLRRKNAWLDQTAKTLQTPGELHLVFKYFSKYVFDSPIPNLNDLVGNNDKRGDYHQTVYQTIERNLGGKMLCDCDDLAEVYADITRRQGKLSYVLLVPGHATCGWVEQTPEGYAMNFLDTGVPRRLVDKSLDMAIEKGVKSYDQRNIMSFNARSVGFLFRFAGEQVRQGYYLDAKVFVDDAYGKALVAVQEAWHYHYFLQGVKTMEEILKKDKASANYFEISGLYREMNIPEKALEYYQAGIDQFDPKDEFGKMQMSIHLAKFLRKTSPQKVAALLDGIANQLPKVKAPARGRDLLEFDLANYYLFNKETMKGFKIIEGRITKDPRVLNERLIYTLISIYSTLNKKVRLNQDATAEEKAAITKLDSLITMYFSVNHFLQSDDLQSIIMKYGAVFSYLNGKYGADYCIAKLKEEKFPKDMAKKHYLRQKFSEEDSWEWIRLNLSSYSFALSYVLSDKKETDAEEDDDDKDIDKLPTPEKWKEAFLYQDLMEKTYVFQQKNGLAQQNEYSMLTMRLLRGAVEKKDSLVNATFDRMEKDNWTAFYRMVTETVAGLSSLLPQDEFIKIFRNFSAHNPPKQHFFGIAYRAIARKKYDIALAVAEIANSKFQDDPKVKMEYNLLKSFVAQLKAKK